jgi:hypothetical protein
MSTLPVVEEILRETGLPMSVREIVEYAKGRLPTKSKTPDTVVARDLSMDIKRKSEGSLFERVSPGRYTLRSLARQHAEAARPDEVMDEVTTADALKSHDEQEQLSAHDDAQPSADAATSMLSAAMKRDRAGALPAKGDSTTAKKPAAGPVAVAGQKTVSPST